MYEWYNRADNVSIKKEVTRRRKRTQKFFILININKQDAPAAYKEYRAYFLLLVFFVVSLLMLKGFNCWREALNVETFGICHTATWLIFASN